ncbi:fructose-specific PTS transporter subunit EIIC [Streptomyces prunicolor]|uniref:fructose-specific PTS transporter subunit EIIC n=1 Tax=Streptomyces prunicolor TaxID=67348 RepID=UPI003723130F
MPRTTLSRWLTANVPHFGPYVAIAAAMNVLALALGGTGLTDTADQILGTGDWTQLHTWAALLLKIGISGLGFLPVGVAAYVAYGVAGRPALVPGLLGGMAAMGMEGGLLVGLTAGLIAGATTLALQRVPVPAKTPAALVPFLASLITSAAVFVLADVLLNPLTTWLHQKMAYLEFHDTALLGVFLGLMVCSDLGGMISKTAVAFGTVGVSGYDASKFSPIDMTIMAAVVAAGMVPPLALTLATLVRRTLFTDAERTYGKASWLFGATFVPEGAIPFALADPLRVIPASMAGGAVSGALTMTLNPTISVPYGGVLAVGDMGKPLLFAVAVAAGVLVTAGTAIALKTLRRPAPAAIRPATTRVRTGRKTSAAV